MKRLFAAILAVILCLPASFAAGDGFTEELWRSAEPIYRQTLEHPFLTSLQEGKLPKAKFDFYLVQDAQYLRAFGRALSILAAKAPREDWAVTLNQHAIDTLKAERQLHETILASRGIDTRAAVASGMAPTNVAYTNHLLATVSERPFLEGLAAMLPCYWVYQRVGEHLAAKGSPDKDYQAWIDMYAAEGYADSVNAILNMVNTQAEGETEAARDRAKALYLRSTRYEYLFWDMAWREERWAP